MRVRHLDWAEAKSSEERGSFSREDAIIGRTKEPDDPPTLESGEKFEVIIGSDLLYEVSSPIPFLLSRAGRSLGPHTLHLAEGTS